MPEKKENQEPLILTVQEVAQRLKLTQVTIYRLLKSGQMPGFKIGASWRIDEKDLNTYIKKQKKKGSFRL